ncbi:MAG: peroxiredoxin [Aminivibrio sp.]
MRDFSDRLSEFKGLKCSVAGVSPDSAESHKKFAEKLGVAYPLLSDSEKELLQACGFWVQKKMYGREYMGVERSTVIVGPGGEVEKIFRKVRVAGHAEKVLEALRELSE